MASRGPRRAFLFRRANLDIGSILLTSTSNKYPSFSTRQTVHTLSESTIYDQSLLRFLF